MESNLPDTHSSAFSLYQLKDIPETRPLRYCSLAELSAQGKIPQKDLYQWTYTGPTRGLPMQNDFALLEALFRVFNLPDGCPPDFTGHSLSISDVVVLHGKTIAAYYCDHLGFEPLPGFLETVSHPDRGLENLCQTARSKATAQPTQEDAQSPDLAER